MTTSMSDDDFFKMAEEEASRSTCLRRHVGAVAVRDNIVLATGYNGVLPEDQVNEEGVCIRKKMFVPSGVRIELCKGVHAEQSLIAKCAKNGISLNGATLYCTHKPCATCAKILKRCGITQIKWLHPYP